MDKVYTHGKALIFTFSFHLFLLFFTSFICLNSIHKLIVKFNRFWSYFASSCNILNLTDGILFDGICWCRRSQRGLNCKSSLLGPGDPNILPYNTLVELNIGEIVNFYFCLETMESYQEYIFSMLNKSNIMNS